MYMLIKPRMKLTRPLQLLAGSFILNSVTSRTPNSSRASPKHGHEMRVPQTIFPMTESQRCN